MQNKSLSNLPRKVSIVAHPLLALYPRCGNGQRSTELNHPPVAFVVAVASLVLTGHDIIVRKLVRL